MALRPTSLCDRGIQLGRLSVRLASALTSGSSDSAASSYASVIVQQVRPGRSREPIARDRLDRLVVDGAAILADRPIELAVLLQILGRDRSFPACFAASSSAACSASSSATSVLPCFAAGERRVDTAAACFARICDLMLGQKLRRARPTTCARSASAASRPSVRSESSPLERHHAIERRPINAGLIAELAMQLGQIPEQRRARSSATCRRRSSSSRVDLLVDQLLPAGDRRGRIAQLQRNWRSHVRRRRACSRPARARRSPDRSRRLATCGDVVVAGRMIASAASRDTSGERSNRAMRHKRGDAFAVGHRCEQLDRCRCRSASSLVAVICAAAARTAGGSSLRDPADGDLPQQIARAGGDLRVGVVGGRVEQVERLGADLAKLVGGRRGGP